MSILFKHLRVHQVFGANTDVGKTILTTALVRGSAAKDIPVHYLKPVSTGPMQDADDGHVEYFAGKHKAGVHAACPFRFDEPVSPHLAVQLAQSQREHKTNAPSDEEFVNSVAAHIRKSASLTTRPSHMYVETAGGVHSPTLSGTTQADAYRPLLLPTILIGDAHLGGISSTIAAYESLLLRGYTIDLVLLFRDAYYRNSEYLEPFFAERGIHALALAPPHARLSDAREERAAMEQYYKQLVPASQNSAIFEALHHLDVRHTTRITELDAMAERALDTLWWPFVQHGQVKGAADVNIIDSAFRDFFSVYTSNKNSDHSSDAKQGSLLEPQLDGSASWWTQALGHAHPALTLAAARAAGRYGHVMFPQAAHAPALRLADRLLHGPGAGWASRAFFSDDGSTGMEVALKMALRAYSARHGVTGAARKSLGVLGLKGSYHGDTLGAMDACEEGVYTCEWHNAKGVWLDPPAVAIRKGRVVVSIPPAMTADEDLSTHVTMASLQEVYDVEARLQHPLAGIYKRFIERSLAKLKENGGPQLAALVLEPLVMGAGGMIFVDPLFQRVLIDVVRASEPAASAEPGWSGLPVIFDEVFIGLYRLGVRSATSILGARPDISVNAKILTGGLVPLAVTLASDSIFRAFLSENKTDALLHGHSYTAYPVACEVANETLDIIERMAASEQWDDARRQWDAPTTPEAHETSAWSFWEPEFLHKVSQLNAVNEVMTLGTVLSIKLEDEAGGYQSLSAQKLLEPIKIADAEGNELPAAPGGAPFGIHFRTLGNVAYFMLSLNTPRSVVHSMQDRIWKTLARA